MEKEKLEQKYMEFQLLSQQMKQLQNQTQLLENQLIEFALLIQSLDELKKLFAIITS